MAVKFGVLVFPGSNCDHDAYHALKHVMGCETRFIWHKEHDLGDVDVVVVPGGFSYGDYLRSGAIARFSPVMKSVVAFANRGGLVIGICNGFQILLESGLLPGAMLHNRHLRFTCKYVNLRTGNTDTPFTSAIPEGTILRIPVAHGEGNYIADQNTLDRLRDNRQIVFSYCSPTGEIDDAFNPNGAALNIAGICNEKRNVLGMMPHPERAVEKELGSDDGQLIFRSILEQFVSA
jgi:phosphoribosylformylglycinamidine synthase subunit PurQ / glutaminase